MLELDPELEVELELEGLFLRRRVFRDLRRFGVSDRRRFAERVLLASRDDLRGVP